MPYSRANGVKIHYEKVGEGPGMVLLHGHPYDHDLWLYQTAHFSTWFTVIGIDIRGYGRSEQDTGTYDLTDMAGDVLGVMNDEGVDKAVVMGCSMGSRLALYLGQQRPERFAAIVAVGGNSKPSDHAQKNIDGFLQKGIEGYHRDYIEELVAPGFQETRLGRYLLDMFLERGPGLNAEAIAQTFRASSLTIDCTPGLAGMAMPVLVINGEFDHALEGGKKSASLIPGAVHRVIPGAGHSCPLEDPATFDRCVLDFLRGHGLIETRKG
ncbi:MAG: alpha/beta fold hydrolase [Rhodospirillales bacterium]